MGHGGTMILAHESLFCENLPGLVELSIEGHVELSAVQVPKLKCVFVACYRPPMGNLQLFMENMEMMLLNLSENFNTHEIYVMGDFNMDFSLCKNETRDLIELFCSFGLTLSTTEPSRITNISSTCIDNIFTSLDTNDFVVRAEELHVSDHRAQILTTSKNRRHLEKQRVKMREINETNINKFRERLSQCQWSDFLEDGSAEEVFNCIYDAILGGFEQCFPVKYRNRKMRNLHMSEEQKKMKNHLDALAVKAITTKNDTDYEIYKIFKKRYHEELLRAHKHENSRLIQNSENKQKTIWNIIRKETNTRKKKSPDSELCAEELNEYFCGLGENVYNGVLPTDGSAHDYMRNVRIKNKDSCFLQPTDACEIENIIGQLKSKETPDIDDFSTRILKEVKEQISLPLAVLLTNVWSREKGKSVISAIWEVIKKTTTAWDNHEIVELICLDLTKAFDTVDHDILLEKLEYYGVRGISLDLISSYLADRRQQVAWKDRKSAVGNIGKGVPQGSVLGPMLFLIFINDIIDSMECYGITLYADDTSVLVKGSNPKEIREMVNFVLERIKEWFQANRLKLNDSKTQQVSLSHATQQVSSIKLLGLHLESKLGWKTHIDVLTRKLSAALFSIRRIKMCTSDEIARLAYFANFHSLASYGIVFWGGTSEASRVFRLQKRAIRTLCGLKAGDSCRSSFVSGRILTISSMYILACLKYVHQNIEQFPRNMNRHAFNTRNKSALEIPYHRLTSSQKFIDHWGPVFYNKVPNAFKRLDEKRFSLEMKKMLLKTAFYSVQEFLDSDIFT
ncbi:uncharacterized protein LOC123677866 [Harmonia axyridis]|uniref:uncharacterized protein LOC123677866 n=1 Tax=Harmonia axyridis TaxID=115357 RepID=UPI001E276C76|nr:uncharacterized protein LOC123677866 [Harmonia axyridis]